MLRSLKIDSWPASDRETWRAALEPGRGWRRGGAASRFRPATTNDLERRYGYFLQFCQQIGKFDPNGASAALVREDNVVAYVAHVQTFWASITVHTAAQRLWHMARILAPSEKLGWLREIVLDLKAVAAPKIRRPTIASEALMKLGLALHQQGVDLLETDTCHAAKLVRDGLIIALLTACPIRPNNFAGLEVGRSIKRDHGEWWIVLEAGETKNGHADMRLVPDYLVAPLETYLLRARPALMKAPPKDARLFRNALDDLSGPLWFSCFGRPLDRGVLHLITTRTTRAALGVAVNPHSFRSSAATTAAWKGSATPHLASAILQHSDARITDAHYNRAQSFEAAKALGKLLREG